MPLALGGLVSAPHLEASSPRITRQRIAAAPSATGVPFNIRVLAGRARRVELHGAFYLVNVVKGLVADEFTSLTRVGGT